MTYGSAGRGDADCVPGVGRTRGVTRSPVPAWRVAIIGAVCALWRQGRRSRSEPAHSIVAYSSGTLKRIDETRVVRLGYRENSPPFAFLDAKKKPIGYSLDICAKSSSTRLPARSARISPSNTGP